MRHTSSLLAALLFLSLCAGCDSGGESNEAPTASFAFSPETVHVGPEVEFTASATDRDGSVEQYSWDFNGDGTPDASGPVATHAYEQEGEINATLTVTDDQGASTEVSESISVGPPTVAGEWSTARSGSENAVYQLSVEEPRPVDGRSYQAVTATLITAGTFEDTKQNGQFRRPNLQILFSFEGAGGEVVLFLVNVDISDDGQRLSGEIEDERWTLYRQ